ncbi:MAG: hypothetical protein ACJA07_000444 [Rhodococcus sp. (in: high G+C Gram-positive bacteria)]|jgi:hypothetical protein
MTQTIRAAIIQPDGQFTVEDINPEYRAFVGHFGGGYVEALYTTSDSGQEITFWIDEEGKLKGLAPNSEATALLKQWLAHDSRNMRDGDVLVGTAVITGGVDAEGETVGLSEESASEIEEFHRGWHR